LFFILLLTVSGDGGQGRLNEFGTLGESFK